MALIKCPECGNEVSDKAAMCPKCGYKISIVQENEKQPTVSKQSKKGRFVIAALLAICIIIALSVFILHQNKIKKETMEKYDKANELVESGKITDAKKLFVELGDYSDSKERVDELTSKIQDVTDESYFQGMQIINKIYDKEYRDSLQEQIYNSIMTQYGDEWTQVPGNEMNSFLYMEDYVKNEIQDIYSLASTESSGQWRDTVASFYAIIFENAFGRALNDAECSTRFSVMVKFIGSSVISETTGEDYDIDAFDNLSNYADKLYSEIISCTKIDGNKELQIARIVGSCTMLGDEMGLGNY